MGRLITRQEDTVANLTGNTAKRNVDSEGLCLDKSIGFTYELDVGWGKGKHELSFISRFLT